MGVVHLTTVSDEIEAEMVCGLLRSEGIVCSYRHTDLSASIAWQGSLVGGPREVMVYEADLAQARAILESASDDDQIEDEIEERDDERPST